MTETEKFQWGKGVSFRRGRKDDPNRMVLREEAIGDLTRERAKLAGVLTYWEIIRSQQHPSLRAYEALKAIRYLYSHSPRLGDYLERYDVGVTLGEKSNSRFVLHFQGASSRVQNFELEKGKFYFLTLLCPFPELYENKIMKATPITPTVLNELYDSDYPLNIQFVTFVGNLTSRQISGFFDTSLGIKDQVQQ